MYKSQPTEAVCHRLLTKSRVVEGSQPSAPPIGGAGSRTWNLGNTQPPVRPDSSNTEMNGQPIAIAMIEDALDTEDNTKFKNITNGE